MTVATMTQSKVVPMKLVLKFKQFGEINYAKEDLQFYVENLPDVYAKFRHVAQTRCQVLRLLNHSRKLLSLPTHVGAHLTSVCLTSEIPTLKQVGLSDSPLPNSGPLGPTLLAFYGDELETLQRLKEYGKWRSLWTIIAKSQWFLTAKSCHHRMPKRAH